MLLRDVAHALSAHGQDVQPQQHRPDAVFLAHVAGAGACTFFTAQRDLARVEQVAEVLPAGRRLEAGHAQRARHPVDRTAGGHRARDAGDAGAVGRRQVRVGRQHGQRVRRRDEDAAADDQVAVAVAVGCSAQVGGLWRHHQIEQLLGVHQVRVGMVAAEVGQRRAVAHRAGGSAELAFENGMRIGPGDGVHGIEGEAEARAEQAAQRVEVEQRAHQLQVVADRVEDFDPHAVDLMAADALEVDVGRVGDQVFADRQAACVDRVGDALRCRPAVGRIELDAEVAIDTAFVVAGRQDQPTEGLVLADDARRGGSGQDAALPHHHAGEAIGRRDLDDKLRGLEVVVAAIAAHHQRATGKALRRPYRVEHRLHEVGEIVRLDKLGHLLAQAAGAGLHARDGRGGDREGGHDADLT